MPRIVKRDEARQAEITLVLNDNMDVVGVEVKTFQPISLVDFSFDRIFATTPEWIRQRMAAQMFNAATQPGGQKTGSGG